MATGRAARRQLVQVMPGECAEVGAVAAVRGLARELFGAPS
ncbi:hypothetical protein ACIBMZ_08105 [Micromonospora sp. NPDC049900]